MQFIQEVLKKSTQRYGDKPFIISGDHQLSYSDLERLSDCLALHLLRFEPQTPMGILLPNSTEYLICYFAIIKAGHIAVPLNLSYKEEALSNIIQDSCQKALFVNHLGLKKVAALARADKYLSFFYFDHKKAALPEEKLLTHVYPLLDNQETSENKGVGTQAEPDDIALIIYTSGTTGKPKGVCLTHKNLLSNMYSIVDRIRIREDDRMLVIISFYYSYGNSLILSHLLQGATLILNQNKQFPQCILDDLEHQACTSLAGVASNFAILLKRSNIRKRNLPKLRYVTLAGEQVADWIITTFRQTFPKIDMYIMYGQTEACARLTILPPAELEKRADSVGRPIKDVVIQIIDDQGNLLAPNQSGEVVAGGPNIMKGYWNDTPETAKKKRTPDSIYTGDIGRLDEEEYLYIEGRKDEMIKVGGERIFPGEIEEILKRHPRISDAGVVGLKDIKGFSTSLEAFVGTTIIAFVVPESNVTESELIRFSNDFLQYYKIPKKIIFIESIPQTDNGKIQRYKLLRKLEEGLSR